MIHLLKRQKKSEATFISIICYETGLRSLVDDLEGIMKDPFRASEKALLNLGKTLKYPNNLLSLAVSEKGHYLVYDNKWVVAYTIIRM